MNVYIKAARELDEQTLSEVKKKLNIPADEPVKIEVDKSIIGGVEVTYGSKRFDATVKHQLDKLRAHLNKKNSY